MKSLLMIIASLVFIYYYSELFDSATLGIILIILSLFTLKNRFRIDKRYREFISILQRDEYRNIDEALEEYKNGKKYLFGIFNKENTKAIDDFKTLNTTKKDFYRFIEIQDLKLQFIERSIKIRTKMFILNTLLILISYIPFIYLRYSFVTYYYSLYVGGGYLKILIFSILIIIVNNYNLFLLNKRNIKDIKLYDDYSLCFHKNCLMLLNINNDKLCFDDKGMALEINLPILEKQRLHLITLFPFFVSLIISYIFIV